MFRTALIAALALPVLAACGGAETPAPSVAATDAFLVAPTAGRDIASGGLNITAEGAAYTLTAVRADVADRVELHTMGMEDGLMKMRQLDAVDVASGQTHALESGGDHLMFFGLTDGLEAGDTAELQLDFTREDGETVTLNVPAVVRGLDEL